MNSVLVEDINSEDMVQIVANGNIAANRLVAVYKDKSGILKGIQIAIDSNTALGYKNIGNSIVAIANGATGWVNMQGVFTVLSGGTADQLVTDVSIDGEITSVAVDATTADVVTVYGVVTEAGKFLKKKPI